VWRCARYLVAVRLRQLHVYGGSRFMKNKIYKLNEKTRFLFPSVFFLHIYYFNLFYFIFNYIVYYMWFDFGENLIFPWVLSYGQRKVHNSVDDSIKEVIKNKCLFLLTIYSCLIIIYVITITKEITIYLLLWETLNF